MKKPATPDLFAAPEPDHIPDAGQMVADEAQEARLTLAEMICDAVSEFHKLLCRLRAAQPKAQLPELPRELIAWSVGRNGLRSRAIDLERLERAGVKV